MNDFLGRTVNVGDNIVLLKTPIVGEHTFKVGRVIKLSDKKILVEFVARGNRWDGEEKTRKVWRYPEQLIKTNVESVEDEKH